MLACEFTDAADLDAIEPGAVLELADLHATLPKSPELTIRDTTRRRSGRGRPGGRIPRAKEGPRRHRLGHNEPMSDSTLIAEDRVIHVDDLLAAAPIEAGKVGHHTVLSVGSTRVIVLAFERGQHMREHRSHHPLLLQALDGHVRVVAAEQTVELRPGGLLYLPNGEAHSVEALEASRVTLIPFGI